MNILAIETSTEACSAALLRDDGRRFSEFEVAPRQHTNLLPKMMDAVLMAGGIGKAAIDFCAFGNGPGAFTGVRIAASTAQGIGIGLKVPLVPVSTLAILAQVSLEQQSGDSTMVALDARMGEVYWAMYRRESNGLAKLAGAERLDKIDEVIPSFIPACGAGHGWLAAQTAEQCWFKGEPINIDTNLLPDAKCLLQLAKQAIEQGASCHARNIHINYLRNQVAEKSRSA